MDWPALELIVEVIGVLLLVALEWERLKKRFHRKTLQSDGSNVRSKIQASDSSKHREKNNGSLESNESGSINKSYKPDDDFLERHLTAALITTGAIALISLGLTVLAGVMLGFNMVLQWWLGVSVAVATAVIAVKEITDGNNDDWERIVFGVLFLGSLGVGGSLFEDAYVFISSLL